MFSPQHLFDAFGQVTGLGLAQSQMLLVVTMYGIAAISVYYLWPLIFATSTWQKSGFFAALAYVYNPFLIGDGLNSAVGAAPHYALVPLSLIFCVKGLRDKDFKWALALSLLSPFILSDFPTLHTFYFVAFTLVSFSALLALSSHNIRFTVYFLSMFFALSLLINLWWLLPLFQNLSSYSGTLSSVPAHLGVNGYSTVIEVLRFLGKWSFYSAYQGVAYVPYSAVYFDNPIISILSFVPITLAFGALLLRPRSRRVYAVGIIAIVSLFLAKGTNSPGGFLYSSMLDWFPPFKAFRESWYFVQLATIPASLLIGVTTACLFKIGGLVATRYGAIRHSRFERIAKSTVVLVFMILIVIPGWPLLTGDVAALPFNSGSHGVSVPSYYNDLISWDNREQQVRGDFKILELPMRGAYADYNWGYQGGNLLGRSLTNLVSGAGTEYSSSSGSQWIVGLAYKSFYDNSSSFATILSSIGTQYVILETDFNTTFYNLPSITSHIDILQRIPGLEPLQSFGAIMVYQNILPASSVYVPATLTFLGATIDNPQGVVWKDDNFSSGWSAERWGNESPQIQIAQTGLSMTLQSSGQYTASSAVRTANTNGTYPKYLLIRFRTDAHTSMAIELIGRNGSYYPVPLNSPTPGHSASLEWYTLAYQLANNYTITGVRVWITNYHDTIFTGTLELWLNYVLFANDIGSDSDVMQFLSNSSLTTPTAFILRQDSSSVVSSLTATPYFKRATILSVTRESPTSISLRMNITGPTVLFFGEEFSVRWNAFVSDELVSSHFTADGFANAWILAGTGIVSVQLLFTSQTYVLYGAIVSLITLATVLLVLVRRKPGVRNIVNLSKEYDLENSKNATS